MDPGQRQLLGGTALPLVDTAADALSGIVEQITAEHRVEPARDPHTYISESEQILRAREEAAPIVVEMPDLFTNYFSDKQKKDIIFGLVHRDDESGQTSLGWTSADMIQPPPGWNIDDAQATSAFIRKMEQATSQLCEVDQENLYGGYLRGQFADTVSFVLDNLMERADLREDIAGDVDEIRKKIDPWRIPELQFLPHGKALPASDTTHDMEQDGQIVQEIIDIVGKNTILGNTTFSPRDTQDMPEGDDTSLTHYLEEQLQLSDYEHFINRIMSLINADHPKLAVFKMIPAELFVYSGPADLRATQKYRTFHPKLFIDPNQPQASRYWTSVTVSEETEHIPNETDLKTLLIGDDIGTPREEMPREKLWRDIETGSKAMEPEKLYRKQSLLVTPGKK